MVSGNRRDYTGKGGSMKARGMGFDFIRNGKNTQTLTCFF